MVVVLTFSCKKLWEFWGNKKGTFGIIFGEILEDEAIELILVYKEKIEFTNKNQIMSWSFGVFFKK